MDNPTDSPISPPLAGMIFAAAAGRGILRGSRVAVMDRLTDLAEGLLPPEGLLPALSAAPKANRPLSLRDIGETFLAGRLLPIETARRRGCFYSPEPIIDSILDLIWDGIFPDGVSASVKTKKICDPALGCGFFFLRLAERLSIASSDRLRAIRRWAAVSLFGIDIDAPALFLAKVALWLALSDRKEEFIPPPTNFRLGDSLVGPAFGERPDPVWAANSGVKPAIDWTTAFPEVARAGGFDAVIGNPPYEVLTHFRRQPELASLARNLRRSGWYRDSLRGQVDLYRCFIERGLALLRPGGILSLIVPLSLARSAAALPLRRRLLEREAGGDWLLFREGDRIFPGVTQSLCVFRAIRQGGAAARLRIRSNTGIEEWSLKAIRDNDDFILPFPGEDVELVHWLKRNYPIFLGEVVDMRVGEVDQTVYRDCMLRDGTVLLARGEHLQPFRLNLVPNPGRARFLDLKRFLERKGKMADGIVQRAKRFRVFQLGIRNMQSRPRLVAAIAPPGVHAGNSLNVLIPKGDWPIESLAGLLNSRLLDRLFRFASGNNNINLSEVRRLPFPADPDPALALEVAREYRFAALTAETNPADLPEARRRLDRVVEDFYRLPEAHRAALEREARPAGKNRPSATAIPVRQSRQDRPPD
jgi:hypothetical protein